jgi:hypothetical protein
MTESESFSSERPFADWSGRSSVRMCMQANGASWSIAVSRPATRDRGRSTRTGRSTLSGADIIGVSACRDERTLNGHARDLCADQNVTLEEVIGSRLEVHALGDW